MRPEERRSSRRLQSAKAEESEGQTEAKGANRNKRRRQQLQPLQQAPRTKSTSDDASASDDDAHVNRDHDMNDWRTAIRKPINYTVSNDVVRLQTAFVTVVAVLGTLVLFMLYLLLPARASLPYPSAHDDHLHADRQTSADCHCAPASAYNATYPLTPPLVRSGRQSGVRYRIALIADLDLDSKSSQQPAPAKSSSAGFTSSASSSAAAPAPASSNNWHSFLLKGYLTHFADDELVRIDWDKEGRQRIFSSISSAGRGMELSELTVFNGKLYSCDDRTGIVYQIPIHGSESGSSADPIPWVILNDGDGASGKGFKCEWMAVKDKQLHVGGLGKEGTSVTGELISYNPQWIKVVSVDGSVQHVNWRPQFLSLMKAAGLSYPGYMIHESAAWSKVHRRWFFLPRRSSELTYNEVEDERRGTNMLISADESFSDVRVTRVGSIVPTLGYSSFKFLPGTKDRLIVALKSQEDAGNIATFISVFTVDGKIILDDQRVAEQEGQGVKYEGIEFI